MYVYHSCCYHVYYIQIIFGNRIIISLRPFIALSIVFFVFFKRLLHYYFFKEREEIVM